MTEAVANVARKAFSSAANYEEVRSDYPVEAVEFLLQKLGVTDNEASKTTGKSAIHDLGTRLWNRKIYSSHGKTVDGIGKESQSDCE